MNCHPDPERSRRGGICSLLPRENSRTAPFFVRVSVIKEPYFTVSRVASAVAFCPYAFSHEITGFRSTPIFSISHSITSPGFRYHAFGSPEHAATPDTVPVATTSPALYPIGE